MSKLRRSGESCSYLRGQCVSWEVIRTSRIIQQISFRRSLYTSTFEQPAARPAGTRAQIWSEKRSDWGWTEGHIRWLTKGGGGDKAPKAFQLNSIWKHLISLWKLKIHANKTSSWPHAGSHTAARFRIQISRNALTSRGAATRSREPRTT